MAKYQKYDFCGYATKANIRCADGRVILKDAFKDQDGAKVPLVWQHQRNDPDNVIGHGFLERRDDGMYVYGYLNDSPKATRTKALLQHADIDALSIFANQLTERNKQVMHGMIREVSVVIAGANPGARIENVEIQHGDDIIVDDAQAEIYCDIPLDEIPDEYDPIEHADDKEDDDVADEPKSGSGKTAKDVYDTLNDEQKKLFIAAVAHAMDTAAGDDEDDEDDDSAQHNDDDEGGIEVKYNPFEGRTQEDSPVLSHEDTVAIFKNAQRTGSLKLAVQDAALEHGIDQLDILFPEAKSITPTPELISRQMEWVSKVWNATSKSPFSRIKSTAADITMDEARARGYIKGKKKIEEQFSLLKRVTTPQTVYKLQKMDRDDIIDITDFDVVAWMKQEMRMMLNEELARAVLIGDGRQAGDESKINADNIRPVYTDEEVYAIHKLVAIDSDDMTREEKSDAIIDAVYEAREDYRGSGMPTFYCPSKIVTVMLLARDQIGRRLYNTVTELASALRVREIVEVPVMDAQVRETGSDPAKLPAGYDQSQKYDLIGIMVNLTDYRVGADRGGAVTLFDDFDIDYNKYTYLIETRCSGALFRPKSAIVLEKKHTGE